MNGFNNSINKIKELITFFENVKKTSKEKYKNSKLKFTTLKTVDSFVIIVGTSSSISLKLTGFGLIVKPIPTGIAYSLSLSIKVLLELILDK